MRYNVIVRLKRDLVDPQGSTTEAVLHALGYKEVKNVRIGKVITFDAPSTEQQEDIIARINEMCVGILTNQTIEQFDIETMEE